MRARPACDENNPTDAIKDPDAYCDVPALLEL